MSELPLTNTHVPASSAELAEAMQQAFAQKTAVYPLGGQTSLNYGVPAKTPGLGLSLAKLTSVVDYPYRDLTLTVEAGMTLHAISSLLAEQRQQLPIDVPQPSKATIGGVIATNWNGPRRFGYGHLRDYVIGITAVDGRGMVYHGGGRVVKNVAGYDFCKLLTGSLGTLGIISQVTLKVRPIPERVTLIAVVIKNSEQASAWLDSVAQSNITPAAIELASGASWQRQFSLAAGEYLGLVRCEGTQAEVAWMEREYASQLQRLNLVAQDGIDWESAWSQVIEWPSDSQAALVLKANVRPSQVMSFIQAVRQTDASAEFLAHAGNGVVFAKLAALPKEGLSRTLVAQLQPAAASHGGQVVVLSNPAGVEMTKQSVWGGNPGAQFLMQSVKQQFDPAGILNPGRFVVG
jgi:glycolate oxidase FAD binding subunit